MTTRGGAGAAVRRVLAAWSRRADVPEPTGDDPYGAAVRIVMRTGFARMAAARGLDVPDGVLPTDAAVPDDVLAGIAADLAHLDDADVEQLGATYESLLGLTCTRTAAGLVVVPTSARKHAGAHYTPRALADEVVAHALAPFADRDVLDLRIADITVGSGAFLVAAARWLASASRRPVAIADVARRLHGADLDPTAVEISRLSLWLLAAEPGLPVNFLDENLRCADALLDETWAGHEPFDAVVGNPPFLGVKNIRSALGQELRDHYARTLLGGESGRSDLVVFFLARAARLSRGVVGLVLPDAVAEGDSARFGLGALLGRGARIYRADTSRPWPSDAGVRIALVWLEVAGHGGGVLDGVAVPWIGAGLGRDTAAVAPARRTPPAWMPHGHQATIVLGRSLLLTRAEAAALVAADPRAARWVRDYTSGDDLVTSPELVSSRQVLDLGTTELADLLAVPVIAERLDAVRAEREGQLAKYPQLARRWWGFLAPVDRLYDALADRTETIALSKHAKYVWPVLVPTGPVFSNGTIVFPSADRAVYGFLASEPHRIWAVSEGGSRLNQSHRYNPSRLLTTYPFPASVEGVREAGEQLADAVDAARTGLGLGITALLNRVHAAAPAPDEVARIRTAIVEVDRAVLAAHGIALPAAHGLHRSGDRTWFGLDRTATTAVKSALVEQASRP